MWNAPDGDFSRYFARKKDVWQTLIIVYLYIQGLLTLNIHWVGKKTYIILIVPNGGDVTSKRPRTGPKIQTAPKCPATKSQPLDKNLSFSTFHFSKKTQRFCLSRLKNTRVFHGARLHGLHALQILRKLRCGRLDKLKTKPQHPTAESTVVSTQGTRPQGWPVFLVRSGRMTSLILDPWIWIVVVLFHKKLCG